MVIYGGQYDVWNNPRRACQDKALRIRFTILADGTHQFGEWEQELMPGKAHWVQMHAIVPSLMMATILSVATQSA